MQTDPAAAPGLSELRLLIAGALFAAFLFGWSACWLWGRMARGSTHREDRANELVAELLIVEEARDRALAEARAVEAALRAEAEELRTVLETQLRQREAELEAAMDTLRAARADADAARGG